jgi:L-aminopeptidase/D-esterase-like protein
MAQDGLARAIYPVHTPLDGDTVFAAATGRIMPGDAIADMIALGTAAANALARACARAVFEARALPFAPVVPTWQDRFGGT